MSERWQDDAEFVQWMIEAGYLRRELPVRRRAKPKITHSFSGDGIILYMHEAWVGGRDSMDPGEDG